MKFPPILWVKLLAKKFNQLLDSRFAPIGLNDTKTRMLSALAHHSPLTATDLLPWAEVEKASLTGLLQSLERDGLIVREPHPTDRRAVQLSITDKGRDVQQKAFDAIGKANDDLFAVFTEEERGEFERLCGLLFSRLEDLGVACRRKEGKEAGELKEGTKR
jgi:DNA-binding MarR family transcriptional regulator